MSPRLASRITGTSGWTSWMCLISRCSASSAPSAAKCAICGLKQAALSAVASTIAWQKANTASGSSRRCGGNFSGSGSRPTHTSVSASLQRLRMASTKVIVLLQCLVAQAVRRRAFRAEAALLVFLVLAVVAREEFHVRVALEGEDVGGDAVEEPAVMGNHHHAAGELEQRVFQRAQGFDVEVVGGFVEQQHVAALQQGLGQVQAAAFAARERADHLLLVLALEVEAADIGARLDLHAVDVEDVQAAGDFLEDVVVAFQLLAALVDVGELDRRAGVDRTGIRRFLADDHLEQRRLAGAVRADDADDRTRRDAEAQVVDQQTVAEALGHVLEFDDLVAKALARRNEDLVGFLAALVVDRLQLLDARKAGLALGAAALGVLARPLEFLLDRLLARLLGGLFLLQALVLLHEPIGVVALPRNAAAAVELEDPLGGVVEEVAVVGHGHHGAREAGEELFQPFDRFGVEVVGGFVEQQHVRLLQQQAAQGHAALLAAGEVAD